jgi:hypothetical protein
MGPCLFGKNSDRVCFFHIASKFEAQYGLKNLGLKEPRLSFVYGRL